MPEKKRIDHNNILKIGVTGSAGSGKSLVCQRFEKRGVVTLDCDAIARQVVEPGEKGLEKLVELFGLDVLCKDGSLDRRKLRQILINDEVQRDTIEKILHPLIRQKLCRQMENASYNGKNRIVAVEVPLLFESGMDNLFDITIAVIADEDKLAQRICKRDCVSGEDAKKMLGLQMSQHEKTMRADHIIINKGTPLQLFDSVDKLFDKIQKEFLTS
ncbi:MAG: dephospho-CoA kinase [Pseudomonadota bacterium]